MEEHRTEVEGPARRRPDPEWPDLPWPDPGARQRGAAAATWGRGRGAGFFFKTITFFIANSGTIVPIANIPEI